MDRATKMMMMYQKWKKASSVSTKVRKIKTKMDLIASTLIMWKVTTNTQALYHANRHSHSDPQTNFSLFVRW